MFCRVVCCVAAPPLAPDYQRYLEPIQCVDVERLARLPVISEMGRVGRQVILIVHCLARDGHSLDCGPCAAYCGLLL